MKNVKNIIYYSPILCASLQFSFKFNINSLLPLKLLIIYTL